MAAGVFGTPITLDTLKRIYPEPITQKQISDYTMKAINEGGKDVKASDYVRGLHKEYGWFGVNAECLIYNGTGTTLNYVTCKDYHGKLYGNPFPQAIENGQWGGFLHVHPTAGFGIGSCGSVVYRSLRPDQKDQYCDWCFAWRIPYGKLRSNKVTTLIREAQHFSGGDTFWDSYWDSYLDSTGFDTEDKNYGYLSNIMMTDSKDAVVRGVFKMA